MDYYITKYALSSGVQIIDASRCTEEGTMLVYKPAGTLTFTQCFHGEGREWHRSIPSAEKRVEYMKTAKRKSLSKALAKLNEAIEYVRVC